MPVALMAAGVGRGETQIAHLLGRGLGQLRAAVAHIDVPESGEGVYVLLAFDIGENSAATLNKDQRASDVVGAVVHGVQDVLQVYLHQLLGFVHPSS